MAIKNGRSYEAYINSDAWSRRRELYFTKHPKRCVACGETEKIHLHHKTYARMGRELDKDLSALCEFCHSTLHRWHQEVGGDLLDISEDFIEHFRKQSSPKKKEEPQVQAESDFIPKHLRGAQRDTEGRLISVVDWRDEVRNIRT